MILEKKRYPRECEEAKYPLKGKVLRHRACGTLGRSERVWTTAPNPGWAAGAGEEELRAGQSCILAASLTTGQSQRWLLCGTL